MLIRIISVLIVLVLLVSGYYFIRDKYRANLDAEYKNIALVIAESSVAAELYRNDSDSFLVARDSILKQHEMTLEELNSFKEKLKNRPKQWRIIWDYVSYYTDSVAEIHQARLRAPKRIDSTRANASARTPGK